VLDIPQALALMFPRKVKLYSHDKDEFKPFIWAEKLQSVIGKEFLQERVVGMNP